MLTFFHVTAGRMILADDRLCDLKICKKINALCLTYERDENDILSSRELETFTPPQYKPIEVSKWYDDSVSRLSTAMHYR